MRANSKGGSGRSYHTAKSPTLAKKHKPSSQRWLARQLADPYTRQAKQHGYRSRAAFKLAEIDHRYQLFRKGQVVVDLGSAPGGWLQVIAPRIGLGETKHPTAKLIAIDLIAVAPLPNVLVIEGDITHPTTETAIKEALAGKADWVVSDMAAATTGHRQTDQLRTDGLLDAALDLAKQILKPGGGVLGKSFAGGSDKTRMAELRKHFATTRHLKPPASRKQSPEIYVLATGFRPDPDSE